MYLIRNLCHHDVMGGHGFVVDLSREWRELVEFSRMTQEMVNNCIVNCGRQWLDAAGYTDTTDHGEGSRPLYDPQFCLQVRWGEWGPEHITIPGNACGLDIDRQSPWGMFDDGQVLLPHNVDFLQQKYLLLIIFTNIAELVVSMAKERATAEPSQAPAL